MAVNKQIGAVIFDMDGVLVNGEDLWEESRRIFLAKNGILVNDNFDVENIGVSLRAISEKMKHEFNLNHTVDEIIAERKNIVTALYKQKIKPIDGSVDIVKFVKTRGLKTAIGSSAPLELIEIAIQKLAIKNYLDAIVSAQHVGVGKPNPKIFLTCAEKINVNPASCIVIEDSPNGVKAAKAAGMKCIALKSFYVPEEKLKEADWTITRLEEVKNILQSS